jgi:CRISPR-associated protein Csc1
MWIAHCCITLHESLFFATREIGRLYETGRYLHNYALAYALRLVQAPYFTAEQVPTYGADLALLQEQGVYITPAQPITAAFQLVTFKYGEELLHVEMQQATRNTPSFGRAKELAAGSRFECYVLSEQPLDLPRWIRLGKWHSKALVESTQVELQERTGPHAAVCALNPLDVPEGRLHTFDIVSMPPSSLIINARLEGPYYQIGPQGRGLPIGMRYTIPAFGPPKKSRGNRT